MDMVGTFGSTGLYPVHPNGRTLGRHGYLGHRLRTGPLESPTRVLSPESRSLQWTWGRVRPLSPRPVAVSSRSHPQGRCH